MASRVAKNPIHVPSGVEVKLVGHEITVKGKGGVLHRSLHPLVTVTMEGNIISVSTEHQQANANALAGSTRAAVNNMVVGVHDGFQRKLVLVGVGYRAKTQDNVLNLSVGFSHPVDIKMPEGITVEAPTLTEIIIKGSDKQLVSQVAANIRDIRPVEPYKGKGIRYDKELIILKEAKKK